MKLSIIIPVYNVEQTLRSCVQSARITAFDDWEMILVDDGSTDSSGTICDQLAQQEPHIRLIYKANGGLSDARNAGLDTATGRYIAFLDSDDTIEPGTLELMADIMEANPTYDILEFPVAVNHGSPYERRLTFDSRIYTHASDYWIDCEAYRHAYAWNKVYRREIFNGVRFPKGKLFEDVHLLPTLLKRAKTIATTPKGLYYYNLNPAGITQTANGKALNDLLEAHLCVLLHETWLWDGKDIEKYYAHVLNIQLDVYERTGAQPILPLMNFRGSLKLRLLQRIGLKRLCQCIKLLHKVVKPSK